jgi:hypothetical protein
MLEYWVFGIGLFFGFCMALGQILNSGTAFRLLFNSGVNIPLYAVYPVTFRELSRTLFKCSVIQLPLLIPFAMICSAFPIYLTGYPLSMSIIIGFKAAFLLQAGRFIALSLAFSAGTNDSSRFRLRTVALAVILIGLVGLFALLGAAGLFVPVPGIAWGLWFLALVEGYAIYRIYGWFYHANRFDLMNVPRR